MFDIINVVSFYASQAIRIAFMYRVSDNDHRVYPNAEWEI